MTRPFDSARYKALLKGLEATTIRRSQLNKELRYESEFYRKRYLAEDSALARWPKITIGKFANVTDGPHGYHVVDEASPIVMLTAKNAKDWFTDRENADPIAKSIDDANKRSSLSVGDVLLSTRGTVGFCALVTQEVLPANIDQDVARISWPAATGFAPEFVVAYLNSRFGQDHMIRQASGMVQQGLSLQKVRDILIPLLPASVQRAVATTVQDALSLRREAENQRCSAEQTLLRALGLGNWQPPEPLAYTRRASEAFMAQRFDAEHFQPKFQALKQHIEVRGECKRLKDLLSFCQRGKQPDYADSGLPVINSKHVRNGTVMMDEENRLARPAEDNLKIRQGDVLINGTGVGTIGRAAAYIHDSPALPDNHVTILRLREDAEIDPVFLAVQLNSLIGQMQVEQYFKGSSGQIELYPSDIEAFSIWKAPINTQQSIRQNIDSAYDAHRKARALLERAKRAVEVAVEESEVAALALLDSTEEF